MIFQTEIAHILNYAQTLLFIFHMIDSLATALKLQDSILANNLINLYNSSNENFKIDCLLKFLNNIFKTF